MHAQQVLCLPVQELKVGYGLWSWLQAAALEGSCDDC